MKTKESKRHKALRPLTDPAKVYEVADAVAILKKTATTKFNESIDISVNLAKKPVQAEQQIRTTVALPKGSGKKVRVIVFVKGPKEKEAQEAGADVVGAVDLIEKIRAGWMDFDIAIATPDMMKDVGKLGKILGTKGLMPNPKSGTVTLDVGKAVRDFKAGKVEYRANKEGVVHGNFHDVLTDMVIPIVGSVDKQTQRVALKLEGGKSVVVETGLYNLTNDEVPVLVHFSPDRQEPRTLIRLKPPEEAKQPEPGKQPG